jgi:2-polyprenyl-6-methoxyphenol hydroxylase-like FAD-dependent oxidoreductase
LDAVVLGNVFHRILLLGESEDLLSEYERTRRSAFLEWTNPLSIGNKERLTSTDPEKVAERQEFFKNLNTDPEYVKEVLGKRMEGAMPESFEVTPMTNGSK